MARQTYGERMSQWEAEKDEHDWIYFMNKSISSGNLERLRGLVKDGIDEGYSFDSFENDALVQEILDQLLS